MDEKTGDLQDRADAVAGVRTGGSKRLLIVIGVLVVGLTVGLVWYTSSPRTAAEQLAEADELAAAYAADRNRLSAAEGDERRAEVAAAYEEVFTEFEATAEEAAEACSRLAVIAYKAGDESEARKWWEKLLADHPETEAAREATGKLIDSYISMGRARLASDRDKAVETLRKAVKICELYVEQRGVDDADSPERAMTRCRILQDDIADPLLDAVDALEEFIAVEQFAASDLMAEALWRLGRLAEQATDHEKAADYFKRLIDHLAEKDPDSPLLKKAELAYARSVSEYDPDAGEELWRKLAEKYANDPDLKDKANEKADLMAQERQAEDAKEQANEAAAQADAAKKQAEDYRSGRYGGGGGGGGGGVVDSGWGKPVPPAEMLKDFIEQKLNAKHYALHMSLDPVANEIAISGSVELTNEGGDKKSFLLMLCPLMKLGVFSLDGKEARPQRVPGKPEVVRVKLAEPWPAGATGKLVFDCQATVSELTIPDAIAKKIVEQISSAGEPTLPLPLAAPTTTAPAGKDAPPAQKDAPPAEPFDPGSLMGDPRLQLQVNQTGYALSGAAWYPLTIFGDLFTAEIVVEIAGGQKVLCSGRSVAPPKPTEAGVTVSKWVCEKPYFGLYFAYGPFKTVARKVDGLDVGVHFLSDDASKAEAYLDATEKILRFHVSRFGPFPFEKLDVIQVDLPPVLGGVGPASLMFLHAMVVHAKDDVPVNLLAHELSHQWWGNQVPINLIDARYTQWLSEGFATYSDALYTEHAEGDEAFGEHIERMGKLYLDQAATVREEPINKTFMGQSPLYRPVVYEKGALVLHALRYVLGDEVFFNVLRRYVKEFAFKQSTVDDFRRLASQVAGRDLDWFFNEWLDQPGCPRFVLESVTVKAAPDGKKWTVTSHIRQPETLSRMPLDLLVVGEDDRRKVVRIETQLGKQERVVVAEVEFPVVRVELDPNGWVLRRVKNGDDVWTAP